MKTPWWFLTKNPVAILLVPVSWVYFLIGRIVFLFRKIKPIKSKRKIICVGNILAGGVGKTPVVRTIASRIGAVVVMRGYKKGKNNGDVGDEAAMLARAGLVVHVGDRKSNIVLLNKQKDKTPIVMDDGLQNPTIKKDIKILVFDQSIGFGNGFMLPAGPLRVPKKFTKDADAIILIKNKRVKKNFDLPVGIPVFNAENSTISPYDDNEKLVAFAGIGYPKKFFDSLKNVVAKFGFPDHYQYTNDDLQKLIVLANKKNARLITTEKDWVRLSPQMQDVIKYAKLETVIENRFWDWLKERM
ncbi:MAG: tetraacyldisaccharide 4'-kinase [Alphaproteobacteria bacterium]|nr:tetraacyldisaccharide 4'-kinase [Alphaproteobacteria bacterium]